MFTEADKLVQTIHGTPTMATIATTGGGTYIFPLLLEKGNGSQTLVGGFIPYDPAEHQEFLGGKSDRWVAEADARALAMKAYLRAQQFKPGGSVVGIGATSSLMRVQRDPKGKLLDERPGRLHSIYVALQMSGRTITHSLVYANNDEKAPFAYLPDALQIRGAEERLTAFMILNLLAEGCGVPERVETKVEELIVRKEARSADIHPELHKVLFNHNMFRSVGVMCGNGLLTPLPNYNMVDGLIPGSFDPIHAGHRLMRAELLNYLAVQKPDPMVGYEIAVIRADKPPVDYLSLKERLARIAEHDEASPVFLTNTTKFIAKAQIFQQCTFGVGYDTAARIVDPMYTDGGETMLDDTLKLIRDYGARFLVFGRDDEGGEFRTLDDIGNSVFRSMAIGVHETRFRNKLRSRNIRNGKETEQ